MLAGNYQNVKDLSERNDSLRKHLTKRGLLEVILYHRVSPKQVKDNLAGLTEYML
jgi:hypothetical protein